MNWRELSHQLFYEERDKRTSLEVELDIRLNSGVHISIDTQEASCFEGQVAFLELVNVTARWCRMIYLEAPDVVLVPLVSEAFPGSSLQDAALQIARRCDPFGDFGVDRLSWVPAAHVHVGKFVEDGVGIQGRGWLAAIGAGCRRLDDVAASGNPLGAVLAACLGANHLLRTCLKHSHLPMASTISLWNFETDEASLDGPGLTLNELGRTAIVGVGAIGGGIIHLAPLVGLRFASLTLLDKDVVDISNLNRVPMFYIEDLNQPKIDVAQNYLRRWSMNSDVRSDWYGDTSLNLEHFDLVIPAANEHGFQQRLMENSPPIMIAGSTGDDWTAYMQRHIPLKEDCLECRIPTPLGAAPVFTCANGSLGIRTESEAEVGMPKTGAIPYLSLAGSVLATAELAKLALGQPYPVTPNCASLCFRTEEYVLQGTQRRSKANCPYCWKRAVFLALRANSRYVDLSV